MFVRFRKHELEKGGSSLIAELCESYRDPRKGGNPRNRYVAYLGSIRVQDCSEPTAQYLFWRGVETRLARLRLPADDEERIREKLRTRIREKAWSAIVARLSKLSRSSVGR